MMSVSSMENRYAVAPRKGVWIEIFGPFGQAKRARVVLLTESVD